MPGPAEISRPERSAGAAAARPAASPAPSTAAEKNSPRNSVAANSRRSFSVSRAPKYSLISTDAPMQSPETPRMMMFITGLAVPTAAGRPVPGKAPHDDGVQRIVGKLEQIAQNDRYGKAHQMARYHCRASCPESCISPPRRGRAAPYAFQYSGAGTGFPLWLQGIFR